MRVFIVDDDAAIRRLLVGVLDELGLAFSVAANGLEALDAVVADNPQLIVLDLQMPVMDGWTFLRNLRSRGDETPVLVLSAANDSARLVQEFGAQEVLRKPFDIDVLVERVERRGEQCRPSPITSCCCATSSSTAGWSVRFPSSKRVGRSTRQRSDDSLWDAKGRSSAPVSQTSAVC